MAETTGIEWADATANFWMGCTKVSPACDHCYAEADWDHRYGRVKWGPHGKRDMVKAGPDVVRKMQRNAAEFIAEHGRKPRIFVNSLSDVFDNHKSIKDEWRALIWELARECPDVILMLLTKRPQNIGKYLPEDWGQGYPNVWIGTTVENQEEADRRIPPLLNVPAVVLFLSCEPLLGPVELQGVDSPKHQYGEIDALLGIHWHTPHGSSQNDKINSIGWVITGGENGKDFRPVDPDWFRSLRDQCARTNVPFLFKQWEGRNQPEIKAKGRELDGVVHDGYPAAQLVEATT